MALKKEIIFTNGVQIEYHKIEKIEFDKSKLKVEVKSYTNEDYRNQEKTNTENKAEYDYYLNLIFKENEKLEEERDVKQVKQWSEKANNLAYSFKEDLNLAVVSHDFEFENVSDFSMNNIYNLVKETEIFKDSVDII